MDHWSRFVSFLTTSSSVILDRHVLYHLIGFVVFTFAAAFEAGHIERSSWLDMVRRDRDALVLLALEVEERSGRSLHGDWSHG